MVQVTDTEASADCVVMADYNWSLWFFLLLLSSRLLYQLSAEEQWLLRCLTTSCSAAPPDWQLWSAHWQTTRLKGIKEAGTPPSHKLPKKSKLLWERSTLGSQLPRKIAAAAINKHKLGESPWATRPSRQANSNQSQWRYDRGVRAAR